MPNKWPFILAAYTVLAISVQSQPDEVPMDRDQILKLIPSSDDLLDLQEQENLLKLIAAGDSVHSVLCEELMSTNHPFIPGTIIAILGEAKENKGSALACIREYMERHKSDDPLPDSIFAGLRALGKIGNPSDVRLLSHFVETGRNLDRAVANQSIKQIRAREQAAERDAERPARLSNARNAAPQVLDLERENPRSASQTKTEESHLKSIHFLPWGIGAAMLVAAIAIWKSRGRRRQR